MVRRTAPCNGSCWMELGAGQRAAANLLVCLVRPSHLSPICWFALSALLICLQSTGLPCPPF